MLRIASIHDIKVNTILLKSVQERRVVEKLNFTPQAIRIKEVSSSSIGLNSNLLNNTLTNTIKKLRVANISLKILLGKSLDLVCKCRTSSHRGCLECNYRHYQFIVQLFKWRVFFDMIHNHLHIFDNCIRIYV